MSIGRRSLARMSGEPSPTRSQAIAVPSTERTRWYINPPWVVECVAIRFGKMKPGHPSVALKLTTSLDALIASLIAVHGKGYLRRPGGRGRRRQVEEALQGVRRLALLGQRAH